MPLPQTRPEDLPPMKVNTVTMVLTGIGVWVVALVVVLILRAAGVDLADGILRVCGAGILLGLLALAWAIPQHRGVLRAESEKTAADDAARHGSAASPADDAARHAPPAPPADDAAPRPGH
ncbi:DUF2530 domain-containing protein [Georgenia wangjunii]|uniref:DUF2530 domain-containing protein n=1 Tax=Georgenia wangjunii TaxID=3117730 RepID=UPI002F265D69